MVKFLLFASNFQTILTSEDLHKTEENKSLIILPSQDSKVEIYQKRSNYHNPVENSKNCGLKFSSRYYSTTPTVQHMKQVEITKALVIPSIKRDRKAGISLEDARSTFLLFF